MYALSFINITAKRKTNLRNLRNYLQYACQHKKDENITQNFGY